MVTTQLPALEAEQHPSPDDGTDPMHWEGGG